MRLGAALLLIYVAYNVALYGSPELKVLGAVGAFGLACLSIRGQTGLRDKKRHPGKLD